MWIPIVVTVILMVFGLINESQKSKNSGREDVLAESSADGLGTSGLNNRPYVPAIVLLVPIEVGDIRHVCSGQTTI